jgi:hypothetical protein
MYNVVRLEIQPSRYGFIVVPYLPQLKFDYNHVYNSVEDVIKDFEFNNFKFNGLVENFYEFERVKYD